MIAFCLYQYDSEFSKNCYAFRQNYGAKDALKQIQKIPNLSRKYCLKVDISNYFNSIQIPLLLEQLEFIKAKDLNLYQFFEALLTANVARTGERILVENRGAMAGIPISPFLQMYI